MKAGQITAKLRDAVPVEFYEDGNEKARYRNIDIPDSLKKLEMTDFRFITPENGKISFRLFFAPGILPAEFPPAREKMTRAEMAAAKVARVEEEAKTATGDTEAEAIAEVPDEGEATAEPAAEDTEETRDTSEAPAIPETRFNVTGDRRKALVAAVKDFTNTDAVYKGAPSYAYAVGNYIINRTGTLIGEPAPELLAALAEQGFTPEAT